MRHDWIFEVLTDLHVYACRNDLPGVARKIEDAIQEMRRELASDDFGGVGLPRSRHEVN